MAFITLYAEVYALLFAWLAAGTHGGYKTLAGVASRMESTFLGIPDDLTKIQLNRLCYVAFSCAV